MQPDDNTNHHLHNRRSSKIKNFIKSKSSPIIIQKTKHHLRSFTTTIKWKNITMLSFIIFFVVLFSGWHEYLTLSSFMLMSGWEANSAAKQDDITNPIYFSYEQLWNGTTAGKDNQFAPPEHAWIRGSPSRITSNLDISDTAKLTRIPKIIHKVYIDKSGKFPSLEELKEFGKGSLMNAHQSWVAKNPGYDIRFFNLKSCRQYLAKNFHPVFLRAFDCIEAFAGKADFFRMAVIYAEGGWYSDFKQVCLQDNLLDALGKDVDFYGVMDHGHDGLKADGCVSNGFFGAISRHPLISEMLHMILFNVQSEQYGKHPLYTTGPCVLGKALKKYSTEKNSTSDHIMRLGYFHDMMITSSPDKTTQPLIQHKCTACGESQDWANGNNYNSLYSKKHYYCEDAKTLFVSDLVPQVSITENKYLLMSS
eukprot:scaffold5458_cov145-Chaetoceros_neogracile.AAC.1